MVKEVTVRRVGGSVGTTLPKDMADRLHIEPGDRLLAIETEHGILLTPYDPRTEKALALAHGIGLDPVADRGEVTRGSKLNVEVRVTNRSPQPIELQSIEIGTPSGWSVAASEQDGEDGDFFPEIPASLIDNASLSSSF